jgi:hypothetical protein
MVVSGTKIKPIANPLMMLGHVLLLEVTIKLMSLN